MGSMRGRMVGEGIGRTFSAAGAGSIRVLGCRSLGLGLSTRFFGFAGGGSCYNVCEPVSQPARSGVNGGVWRVDADAMLDQAQQSSLLSVF